MLKSHFSRARYNNARTRKPILMLNWRTEASNQISQLSNEKAVNDARLVDCVQDARDLEEERDAALFELSDLRTVVGNLKKRVEDFTKRDDEISRALESEEKFKHTLAELTGAQQSEMERLRCAKAMLLKENQTMKLREHTLSQQNKRLEQENTELKQKFQAFQEKGAVDFATLANIRKNFAAVSNEFDQLRKDRASQPEHSTKLKGGLAEVAENNLPAHKGLSEVQHRKDKLQTDAPHRRGEATVAKNPGLYFKKCIVANASTGKALGKEKTTLKDRLSQVSAQLEHALIGAKCMRDALGERSEELKTLNVAKEKDNWALREALVTAWTQVETLSKQLNTQPEEALITAPSQSLADQEKLKSGDEEPSSPCAECLTTKLELSTVRNHMSIHQKQKEEFKKAHLKGLADNENVQEQLKKAKHQANLNITHFQKDASRARQHTQNIMKNANKVNGEIERQLHAAQFELEDTKARLGSSQSEAKSLAKEITDSKKELKVAMGVLYQDDMTLDKLIRWNCSVFAQKQANLKQKYETAEQRVDNERERYWNFRAKVQKDARELIKRTGGIGSSSHEILGKWADGEPEPFEANGGGVWGH